ncbi:unnamed protein product, partial [Ectocarpus fasciculatus]
RETGEKLPAVARNNLRGVGFRPVHSARGAGVFDEEYIVGGCHSVPRDSGRIYLRRHSRREPLPVMEVLLHSLVHGAGCGDHAQPASVASQRPVRGAQEPRDGRLVQGAGNGYIHERPVAQSAAATATPSTAQQTTREKPHVSP